MIVMKRQNLPVTACRLGDGTALERRLIASGALRDLGGGRYEVFSREAQNGAGELARAGCFVKLDGEGFPYPNSAEYFLSNHDATADGYVQRARPLEAWREGQPVSGAVRFLLDSGRLRIDRQDPLRRYSARLWGTVLSADRNAVIVFYEVRRGPAGTIEDAQFGLVAGDEFEKTYDIIKP